ncbi:Protein SFI1 [Phytophthora citrophthora]|uniref:Protein SFI1 n=1 Tax=Phytophthora citrophthora TaxID=4793 RepID=A0AAD9LSD0_9STRA|nr:Protein SFI1 [Phytophthora citrophthora]
MAVPEGPTRNRNLESHFAPSSPHLALAVHYDRHRQLQSAFKTWKRRVNVQCVRRKRIAAACRVGATFYQRIFWEKWRAFVAQKRQETTASIDTTNGTESIQDNREDKASRLGSEDGNNDEISAATVRKKHTHYRYRGGLLHKHKANDAEDDAVVVRIRRLYAIRRWREFVRLKRCRDVLQQRAYFFLYYWLLKRSLNQLCRNALLKKKERALTVKIGKENRHRLMVQAMQKWRLRLQLHQTLRLWQSYARRRRHETLLYRPIAEELTRMSHRRLLRFTFNIWEKQHSRNQGQRALVHLLDRHLYRKVCERAWKTWKTMVDQLIKLESFTQGYQERRLRRIWNAWSARTREKQLQEQQRRCAVRHQYLSLLRKGFIGFQVGLVQRRLALNCVDNMQDAADHRMMALAFSRWDHFTSERKLQAHKVERAVQHYKRQLLKRVWSKGFHSFYDGALAKKNMLLTAQEHNYVRTVGKNFRVWKTLWQSERCRDQALEQTLGECLVVKEQATKARVFENWTEFARDRAAKRVVNAQMRGQAHQRMLQTSFSRWVTFVSVLRWQQITQTRAEQHYKAVLWKKCFERWQYNVALRQRYRKKVRMALIHWKLTLERKAFNGWKQYLNSKRSKQQRIHEALEFRHEQFLRDGVRHWMTAALHLQEQREQQVARAQASNTAQVWRRVAAIARHWRYLAVRRRAFKNGEQTLGRSRKGPQPVQENLSWQLKYEVSPPSNGKKLREAFPGHAGGSNWIDTRSPLSEFLLIPRNRPQPRRPIDVLLFSQAETENLRQQNQTIFTNEALRYGFEFPVEPLTPLRPPSVSPPNCPQDERSCNGMSTQKDCKRPEVTQLPPREAVNPQLPQTTAQQLDILERQIVALSQRKREWKVSRQQLEVLRSRVETTPQLAHRLRDMEQQHILRTKQWFHTKERIRYIAAEIQQLRSALRG